MLSWNDQAHIVMERCTQVVQFLPELWLEINYGESKIYMYAICPQDVQTIALMGNPCYVVSFKRMLVAMNMGRPIISTEAIIRASPGHIINSPISMSRPPNILRIESPLGSVCSSPGWLLCDVPNTLVLESVKCDTLFVPSKVLNLTINNISGTPTNIIFEADSEINSLTIDIITSDIIFPSNLKSLSVMSQIYSADGALPIFNELMEELVLYGRYNEKTILDLRYTSMKLLKVGCHFDGILIPPTTLTTLIVDTESGCGPDNGLIDWMSIFRMCPSLQIINLGATSRGLLKIPDSVTEITIGYAIDEYGEEHRCDGLILVFSDNSRLKRLYAPMTFMINMKPDTERLINIPIGVSIGEVGKPIQ